MDVVRENEKIKALLMQNLIEKMPNIEQGLIDNIFKYIDELDYKRIEGIGLSAENMYKLNEEIKKTLLKYGYYEQAELFISDFGKISIMSSNVLKSVTGVSIAETGLSIIEQKWKYLTYESLMSSGLNENFKTPILKLLDNAIIKGESITAAKKTIQEYIVSDSEKSGKLKSYSTQIARDSLRQMQGQQYQSVANAVQTEGVRYIGGLLEDSRGQCYRWVEDLKGFIAWEQLESEISMAYRNQNMKLVKPAGHKWGGMMPNTTMRNFTSNCGGYNCTHSAIPVRKKPK